MGLMLPRFSMGKPQSNLSATPNAATVGTTITAHATLHTKGSWVQIIAATDFDVYGLTVCVATNSTAATAVYNLVDIGIGAAAAEQVLIPNIRSTLSTTAAGNGGFYAMFWPLFIPKGTRIAARKQSNITVKTSSVLVFCHGGPSSPPWPTFQSVIDIGTDLATSGGTPITSGSSGTESAWTNVGSTLPQDIFAVMPAVGTHSDTDMLSQAVHMEVGYSSTLLGEYFFVSTNAEAVGSVMPNIPIYAFIPAGTQMQMRIESQSTGEALQYAMYGFR